MFEQMSKSANAQQGQARPTRLMRSLLGFAMTATVLGFGAAQGLSGADATSMTAMPIPPPCLLNNRCGIGDRDNEGYYSELRAACEELWSRGLNSSDCAYLNE
ncbi:hypothetical protein [Mycobacterium sp. 23]|uniref:hypothetical protein n=1 Tax=Mycobacterium sp. 23 TaxID=3400424 RepID=UPI003AAA83EB